MANLPPVSWLQAFEAAGRTLSFTRAGEELSVTQSAISQRIRMLEARLGQDLFIRHPRSLTLTEAGRAWLPSVQDAFNRLARGTAEVFGPEPEAPVTIRATPAIQQFWLAPRLHAFQQCHPQTPLRVVTGVWPDDFVGEDVDMEIRYGLADWSHLVQCPLGSDAMTPVCVPQLANALSSSASLVNHTLLHTTGFVVGWSTWLEAAGLADIETRHLWCDTQSMTLRLATEGCGVALAHQGLIEGHKTLVAPFELSCPTREQFVLTRPQRRSLRAPAECLWHFLKASIE